MNRLNAKNLTTSKGFSLIEVVLAIGIFLVTVLALVGLLGPTLQSVDEVQKTDEVSSIVNTINAYLHSSPDINPGGSNFNTIYTDVATNGSATLLVFRAYDTNERIGLKIGFVDAGITANRITAADIYSGGEMLAAGTIYRAVLTPSSVNPANEMTAGAQGSYPMYTMNNKNPTTYLEGSFAMEVRIFAEAPSTAFNATSVLADLALEVPIFTYNMAIVR